MPVQCRGFAGVEQQLGIAAAVIVAGAEEEQGVESHYRKIRSQATLTLLS